MRPFTVPHFVWWASSLILDDGEPWKVETFQKAFVRDVFRGVPECWFIVPEGNGKTTLVAGLALYFAEFQPLAAIPVAASSREQAQILYRQAEGFVLRTPRLHELVHSPIQAAKGKRKTDVPWFVCLEGYRRINYYLGSRIQIFAADESTGDGVIPTLAIIDELHRHRSLGLYRTWAGKLPKRQGQVITISTAGEPYGEFEATREAIRQAATTSTRKGAFLRALGPGIVLHEWALPEGEDPEDFRAVKRCNPFSRITIATLRQKFHSPTMTLAHWQRLVCNTPTRAINAAITEAEWAAARTTDQIPEGEGVWLGLDVGWKYDTTAMVPLWMRDREYRLFGPASILVPPRDGSMLNPELVEGALYQIHRRNPIHTVVMDTSKAEELAQWIETEFEARVVDRAQTNTLAVEDYDRFMEGLRLGWLHHSGDPGFTQHALNAVARMLPQGDTRFDRPVRSRKAEQDVRVIDALTAASMVHALAAGQADAAEEALVAWR